MDGSQQMFYNHNKRVSDDYFTFHVKLKLGKTTITRLLI